MKTKGLNITDGTAEKIGEVLTAMVESCTEDWRAPWIKVSTSTPRAYASKKDYNGINAFLLALYTQSNGYKTATFMTIKNINDLELQLNKTTDKDGKEVCEKPFPVFYWHSSFKKGKEYITEAEYENLSQEDKELCTRKWFLKTYNVWNIDHTNYAEKYAEKYQTLVGEKTDTKTQQDFTEPILDYMIDGGAWICPIKKQRGDEAYYSISKNEIVLPEVSQFKQTSRYYGTALHEMAHSTGAEKQLNRLKAASFASKEYAKEELIAELSSAIVMNDLGCEKYIKEDSIPYVKSWIKTLKNKDAIKVLMNDIMRVVALIKREYASAEKELADQK